MMYKTHNPNSKIGFVIVNSLLSVKYKWGGGNCKNQSTSTKPIKSNVEGLIKIICVNKSCNNYKQQYKKRKSSFIIHLQQLHL